MAWTKDNLPDSVKAKKWGSDLIETFCALANEIHNSTNDESETIATALKRMEEIQNSLGFPEVYYCRHMQPGTCGYDNEVILVDIDVLKKMIASGTGKPVYLDHPASNIIARLKNIKEEACGYIADSFYNELDGWAWFKFIVIDEKSRKLASTPGMGVSNGYAGQQWGSAGTKNNVPYARELLMGEFTQLAIVPNPRYEGSLILTPDQFKAYQESKKRELEEIHNSKTTTKGKPMFKLFKNVKTEVSVPDADTIVELEDGKQVTIAEMINAVKKNSEDEKKKEEMENADPEVDCGGEMLKVSELKNRYMKMNEKKNAEEKEKEAKEAEEKKNAEEEEKKKKEADEAEEKKNSKFFEELSNANKKAEAAPTVIETGSNKVARGKARYGSK